MEVTPGYKQTEIGVIPEDWELKELGNIASITSGGTPSRKNPAYWGGDIPWITTSQIDFNKITSAEQYITEIGLKSSAAKILAPGTLLLALYGQGKTRGKVCILGIQAATNQACASIDISSFVSREFVFHVLASKYEVIRGLSNSGSQENLNGQIVKSIPIPLPPTRAEQETIAEVLSNADALIESYERLIAKKRILKKGVVQQLLRPKDRWVTTKLGRLGAFLKGSGVRKDESMSGDLPCVRYGEIYTKHNNYIKGFHSWISKVVAATARRLKTGDLLFAGSGETKEEIGKCVAFVEELEAYAGGDIVILRPENTNSVFMGYYLNTAPINRQKASKGQGDAVVHISASALADIDITIPPFEEQTTIAAVLSAMDTEIALLETQLAKYREIKQGLMHNLLTGRVRLIGRTGIAAPQPPR